MKNENKAFLCVRRHDRAVMRKFANEKVAQLWCEKNGPGFEVWNKLSFYSFKF